MQKFVLPILVMLLAVGLWLLFGKLGWWSKTGKVAKKEYKELFTEDVEEEKDAE